MEIIDSNKLGKDLIYSDVCIIGAGPAGITLAAMLADSNLNVIIAESGGEKFDEVSNELNHLKITSNFNYREAEIKRNRQIGGTANLWAGRVVPFTFDPVLDAEWSGLKEEILPYYDDAFRFFGVDPAIQNEHPKNYKNELYAYWAQRTERFNTGSEMIQQVKIRRIYHHLTCVGEPKFSGEQISRLSFVNRKGQKIRIHAVCYVFAMGAIENSRMLLVIRDQMGGRMMHLLRNAGKYVMDHPRIWHGSVTNVSRLSEIDRYQIKSTHYGLYKTGIRKQTSRMRVYCNLMRSVKRITSLLNMVPGRSFQVSSKKLLMREKGVLKTVANECTRIPFVQHSQMANNYLTNFFNSDYSPLYHVMTYFEQIAREENQITIGKEKDRNNLPIPILTNNIQQDELDEILEFYKSLEMLTEKFGCKLDYNPEFIQNSANYTDASHSMGGTRYSAVKSKGVVDKNLRVTGIPNLYITGSSVFPTGGVENPTHLIVSMSCYLAGVLKGQHRKNQ